MSSSLKFDEIKKKIYDTFSIPQNFDAKVFFYLLINLRKRYYSN